MHRPRPVASPSPHHPCHMMLLPCVHLFFFFLFSFSFADPSLLFCVHDPLMPTPSSRVAPAASHLHHISPWSRCIAPLQVSPLSCCLALPCLHHTSSLSRRVSICHALCSTHALPCRVALASLPSSHNATATWCIFSSFFPFSFSFADVHFLPCTCARPFNTHCLCHIALPPFHVLPLSCVALPLLHHPSSCHPISAWYVAFASSSASLCSLF